MSYISRQAKIVLSLVAVCGLASSNAASAKGPPDKGGTDSAVYEVIDLPGPNHATNGGFSQCYATAISNPDSDGTIYAVGWYYADAGRASCVWTVTADGTVVSEHLSLDAKDVNSAGMIATADAGPQKLIFSDGSTIVELPTLGGPSNSIHALGDPQNGFVQVVGVADTNETTTAGNPVSHGVLWDVDLVNGLVVTTDLSTAGLIRFAAADVNSQGVMCGWSDLGPSVASFDQQGVLQITPLTPVQDLEYPYASMIDDLGNVAGDGSIPTGSVGVILNGLFWSAGDGTVTNLSTASGINSTLPNGIATVDGVSQVVGRGEDFRKPPFAFLWMNGTMFDLNKLIGGGWTLREAGGVNATGHICGSGSIGSRKSIQYHGFLLRPMMP